MRATINPTKRPRARTGAGRTLVIGGGAIGMCTAYFLARSAHAVTVIERDAVGSGCSHGNAGLVVPSYCIPLASPGAMAQGLKWMFDRRSPFVLKPRLDPRFIGWLWQFALASRNRHLPRTIPVLRDLSLASIALFEKLAKKLDFGWQRKGLLDLFETPRAYEQGMRNAQLLASYGIQYRIVEPGRLAEMLGGHETHGAGAIFFPLDAQLVPRLFTQRLAECITREGGAIKTATEVLGFQTKGRRVTAMHTTRGNLAVDQVVLAGGAWSAAIAESLGIRLLLEPAKGYSLTFKRPENCPPMPINLAEAKVLITPMGDSLRIAGMLELCGLDLSVNTRRVQAVLDSVSRYLPGFAPERFELREIWRGLRPCSPDGLPYIGRPAGYDNVIVATGHGMLGISLAPITGKIVSQMARGLDPPVDPAALGVERFDRSTVRAPRTDGPPEQFPRGR